MPELTAPLVMKNDEKRIVYGPVLIPNEPDTDNDVVSAEKIEEVAHQFVENYGNIDLMHSLNNVGKMIESYILPMDLQIDDEQTVPKGSWMLGVRVTDDDSWEAVKNQKLGGFSIMAIPKRSAEKSANKGQNQNVSEKRTTLADLEEEGDGWIVNAVSLVDEPAVPKSKYIAVKSKDKRFIKKGMNEEVSPEVVQKAVSGSLEDRERLVRRHTYATFDSEITDSYVHSTFQDYAIIRIHDMRSDRQHLMKIGYEIDQHGNVNFTDSGTPVRIEENVVEVEEPNQFVFRNEGESDEPASANKEQTSDEKDGFMQKLMKSIFNPSEKSGRSISEENYERLTQVQSLIAEMIEQANQERSNKSAQKGASDDMNEEQVKKQIDDQLQPLKDQITELTNTFKGVNQQEQEQQQDDQTEGTENQSEKSQSEDSSNDESNNTQQSEKSAQGTENHSDEESAQKALDQVMKELEEAKRHQPFSKRLAGQDNEPVEKGDSEETPDRNAFGFKKKA